MLTQFEELKGTVSKIHKELKCAFVILAVKVHNACGEVLTFTQIVQHISDEVCFANTRQPSEMHQFVLILQALDQFKKLDLTWHKVGDLSLDALELDVVTATVKFSFLLRPSHVTVLGRVFVLTL